MKDLTGLRVGNLTVISFSQRKTLIPKKRYKYYWNCQCDCGNIVEVEYCNLFNGKQVSCGCYKKEQLSKKRTIHGLSKHRLMGIYRDMKKRCKFNPHYNGRGIIVCEEWEQSFKSFYSWAIDNGYQDDLTIERINVNDNYCPENCTWITLSQQAKNTTRTKNITINGVKMCLKDWCKKLNLNYKKIQSKKLSVSEYTNMLRSLI